MAPAVHTAHGAVLHAVASRDADRSRTLEPNRVHGEYADLLDDPEVEVVYISLRNGQHREWVERALTAGKHVLCEKPLGVTASEVRSMFATAEQHGRLLVEAVWAQWHPRFARLLALARSGSLGELVQIDTRFTFTSDTLDGNYRLDPTMGGGALLDVGCYQVHTWASLIPSVSTAPKDVSLVGVSSEVGPTGVDLTTSVRAVLGSGIRASMHCSFVEAGSQSLRVEGTRVSVRTGDGEAFTTWREPSSLWVGGTEEHFAPVDAFTVMTEAVSARVRGDDAWIVPADQSLAVAELVDAIRNASSRTAD